MKKKRIIVSIIGTIILIPFIMLFIILGIWHNELSTIASIKTIANNNLEHKDGYTYEMTISGDYYLDDFINQGGVKSDSELITFITNHITKGLIPMKLEQPEIGCSSFTATSEDGEKLFGRNYDFKQTSIAVVHTNPGKDRYKSISTIDLGFLGIDEKGINGLMHKVKALAAPFVPLDGINEKGVACGIYMTYQGPDKEAHATNQDTVKPDITSTTLLRIILDYADDVEEAIKIAEYFDMHDSAGTSFHYMVADKEGNSAVLEWVGENDNTDTNGKIRKLNVIRNEKNYQTVTNFILTKDYYSKEDDMKGLDRYNHLEKYLKTCKGTVKDEVEAMNLLAQVGRRNWKVDGDLTMGTTIHSVVYNLTDLTSYFIPNENFDLETHNFFYSL